MRRDPYKSGGSRRDYTNSETTSEKMATMSAIKDFTVEELCEFLSSYDLSEGAVDNFRTNRICGTTFFELDTTDLKELLPLLGDRKQIQRILSSYQPTVSVSNNVTSYVARVHFMQLPTTPLPTSAAVAHAGTSWISSDTFSKRTHEGIATGVVTRGQRIEIIEVIAYRVLAHTEFPSSSEYIGVCEALIEKYPTIKDTVGNGYVSVCIAISSLLLYLFPSGVMESATAE